MEALTGVSVGLLTIYDMIKAIDKSMIIDQIMLLEKSEEKVATICEFNNEPKIHIQIFGILGYLKTKQKARAKIEEALNKFEYKILTFKT